MVAMRMAEAIERFTLQLRANGRSGHTVAQYRRHLELLARWAAAEGQDGDLRQLDHGALAAFLASPVALTRAGGGAKKASTVNALRSSLKGFFGYLHRAGYLREDPSRLVRRAQCDAPLPRGLAEGE